MKRALIILILVIVAVGMFYGPRLYYKMKRMGYVNRQVPLASISDSAVVFLVAGQSTAANSGNERFAARNEVYNFWNGKLYTASDPLMGADGNGGSPWCLLGDMIIDSGIAKQVVIAPIAQSETSVKDWAGGNALPILINALQKLRASGLKLDFIIWQQGESDVGKASTYGPQLRAILDTLRSYYEVPVFVSLTSYNHIINSKDTALRNVQKDLIDSLLFVLRGPDTDSIPFRFDQQHFSGKGLKILAHAWLKQIKQCEEIK